MSPDPVVVDVRDPAVPRACADVLRTSASSLSGGRRAARMWFEQLPGLTLVAVVLPRGQVVFLGRQGGLLHATTWRPGVAEHVYVSWVRTMSASGEPSDR
ncbi:hypothetical protein SAMN04488074_114192 [Lentzea albidocapillata subsp. violacea]|uniref:Uncharacterized protein n=1 Tax=Lentzea albidocapillata subsp. violacea TaxID=128104 RepID=A0A1G9NZH4_9PSEU|nr:hypothetical protein [Lentzea albidocapillata]SDL91958.1 hypothetical protein SAMN04488074_114192 [Lentzea albidocapillata subsp. violacea]